MNIWCKGFQADRMLGYFRAFLETVPFSVTRPGFSHLVVRAVDASESPVVEHDLRSMPLDAARIIGLLGEHLHEDSSFEVHCQWDLWVFDESGHWVFGPQLLKIFSHGEEYDNSFSQENGHIEVDLGFEHLFTGHAGLLGVHGKRMAAESPEEARFLEAMAWPENLEKYREKTQENIRKLFDWLRHIEKAIPVERFRLWSEGEENFEARLEQILLSR
jgi:hypothetical protein